LIFLLKNQHPDFVKNQNFSQKGENFVQKNKIKMFTLLSVFIGAIPKLAMVNRPTGVIIILAGRKSVWAIGESWRKIILF